MTNIDAKPGPGIPFRGYIVSILQMLEKDINQATPRM